MKNPTNLKKHKPQPEDDELRVGNLPYDPYEERYGKLPKVQKFRRKPKVRKMK